MVKRDEKSSASSHVDVVCVNLFLVNCLFCFFCVFSCFDVDAVAAAAADECVTATTSDTHVHTR